MSDGTEGNAVVTTDQIYAELRQMGRTLLELTVRFEIINSLEKRISALEDEKRRGWQLPVAWSSAAAGTFAAVYQTIHPGQ